MRYSPLLLSAALLLSGTALAGEPPKVIASIVPVHSLVAGVMEGVGTPELLLSGQTSEHNAAFTPAQIASLGKADAIFIVGKGLELKLPELSGSDAVNGKTFVELMEAPGMKHLPIREGGTWEAHHHGEEDHDHEGEEGHNGEEDHDHDGEGHEHGAEDPHVWTDPDNAKAMVAAIAAELSRIDPANATAYAANATQVSAGIDSLDKELAAELEPVRAKPFIVFHDAYQYFEARYGLAGVGSISNFSATAPSAQRLAEIRARITETGALCVFREPQFPDQAVTTVIEGTKAKAGVLDGIGANLEPGPAAFGTLMRSLAGNLKACLAG
jgi:zinc transport system substrate-binding protein